MDQVSFDRLATVLGTAASRRSGVIAAMGAALGLARAADARPHRQGPCGDGSRNENRCTKNGECCTGICDTSKGKTNKDGEGRCRCRRRGKACTEDRNCCARQGQAMICIGGVCASQCAAVGAVCDDLACCAGTCNALPTPEARSGSRLFSGSICCLQDEEAGCTADIECCGAFNGLSACVGGVCATTCLPLQSLCTVNDTCCAGTCTATAGLGRGAGTQGTERCCIPLNSSGCGSDQDCCAGTCINSLCET
jgi:hypothetical protein